MSHRGEERDARAVGRPDGTLVERRLGDQRPHFPVRDGDRRDARLEPVVHVLVRAVIERDPGAVGRPRERRHRVRAVGQAPRGLRHHVDHVQVSPGRLLAGQLERAVLLVPGLERLRAGFVRGVGDARAVRGPGEVVDAGGLVGQRLGLAAGGVHEVDLPARGADRRERHRSAVGRPGRRAAERSRCGQLACGARLHVGHPNLRPEEIGVPVGLHHRVGDKAAVPGKRRRLQPHALERDHLLNRRRGRGLSRRGSPARHRNDGDPSHVHAHARAPPLFLPVSCYLTWTVLMLTSSRMPTSASARPYPDSLVPPKGSRGSDLT